MKINNQNLEINNTQIFFYSSLSILFFYLDFITYIHLLFSYIPCLLYPNLRCHYQDKKLPKNLSHLLFCKKEKNPFPKNLHILPAHACSNLFLPVMTPSRIPQAFSTTVRPNSALIISNATQIVSAATINRLYEDSTSGLAFYMLLSLFVQLVCVSFRWQSTQVHCINEQTHQLITIIAGIRILRRSVVRISDFLSIPANEPKLLREI